MPPFLGLVNCEPYNFLHCNEPLYLMSAQI